MPSNQIDDPCWRNGHSKRKYCLKLVETDQIHAGTASSLKTMQGFRGNIFGTSTKSNPQNNFPLPSDYSTYLLSPFSICKSPADPFCHKVVPTDYRKSFVETILAFKWIQSCQVRVKDTSAKVSVHLPLVSPNQACQTTFTISFFKVPTRLASQHLQFPPNRYVHHAQGVDSS